MGSLQLTGKYNGPVALANRYLGYGKSVRVDSFILIGMIFNNVRCIKDVKL